MGYVHTRSAIVTSLLFYKMIKNLEITKTKKVCCPKKNLLRGVVLGEFYILLDKNLTSWLRARKAIARLLLERSLTTFL